MKNIKYWLKVGSQDGDFNASVISDVTSDANLRPKLVKNIFDILNKLNFDGVYIYWNFPGCPVN